MPERRVCCLCGAHYLNGDVGDERDCPECGAPSWTGLEQRRDEQLVDDHAEGR